MDLCWLSSRPEDGAGLPGLRAKIIDLDEGLHMLVQPQASAWNQWPDAPHLRTNIGLYKAQAADPPHSHPNGSVTIRGMHKCCVVGVGCLNT